MELEQRVQALEQELQILKNQIQSMLLDIQEQVLSNTYPDLRSGDNTPQGNRPVSRPESEPEVQKRPSSPVHKVSLDNFAGEEERQTPPPAEKQTNNATWQGMANLEAWVSEKLSVVGLEDTLDLIRMYGANGRFSAEVQDALLEFAVYESSRYHDAPTQPSRSAVFNTPPGVVPSKPAVKKAAPVRSVPAEPAPQRPNPAKATPKAAPVNSNKKKASKAKVETVNAEDEGSTNIVLKLIAGVQNAGAGVRWGKDDNG